MTRTDVEVMDFYDAEVVRRIVVKYGYAESADVTFNLLKANGLLDYAVGMYDLYHVEAIENAFADLDCHLKSKRV